MKSLFAISLIILLGACSNERKANSTSEKSNSYTLSELSAILDTIWQLEQTPIRKRDSIMNLLGSEAPEYEKYQKIYRANHSKNIIRIKEILALYDWPPKAVIGVQGNNTICNVLQHADQETRESYIPQMKQAVLDGELGVRWLVRAEDRLATDKGELQIYGGQMKYYPETKSFNVWPVFEPEHIDARRAEIGLEPIEQFLKARFDFDWGLEEQKKRTEAFLEAKALTED